MSCVEGENALQTREGSIILPSQAWIRPPALDDVITTAIGDQSIEHEKEHTIAIVPAIYAELPCDAAIGGSEQVRSSGRSCRKFCRRGRNARSTRVRTRSILKSQGRQWKDLFWDENQIVGEKAQVQLYDGRSAPTAVAASDLE